MTEQPIPMTREVALLVLATETLSPEGHRAVEVLARLAARNRASSVSQIDLVTSLVSAAETLRAATAAVERAISTATTAPEMRTTRSP